MAVETVVIRIVGDTKEISKTIAQLEKVGRVDRQNAASFKKTNDQFKKGTKQVGGIIGKLENDLKRLQKARQRAFRPEQIKAFNKAISRTEKDLRKLQGQAKSTGGAFRGLGSIILGAFAVSSLVNFVKDLSGTAAQMEAFEKRAAVVFGNSIGIVEEFAKKNAISLGLSENAFKGAAAAVGDILVPLGLSRQRAAEMSVEAVKLGSALKEFTGDQRSAAEIADIVARSFTGETEGLKGLGVVINQNDKDFKALQKSKIANLGLTEQQAKAEAIFETVLARSSDALTAFETNTDSLTRQQAELDAQTQTLTEGLATLLTPAFLALTKAANESVTVLNEIASSEESLLIRTLAMAQATGAFSIQLFDLSKFGKEVVDNEEELFRLRELSIAGLKVLILQGNELAAQELERRQNAGENVKTQAEQIRNIFFLTDAIKKLKDEQRKQGTSLKRVAAISRELIPLQKELNALMGKGGALTATELLNKRIGELRKELLNQALAGGISKETLLELELAVDELEQAELRLKGAILGTLEPLKAQELQLEKIGEQAQSTTDLIEDFNQIQREEIEKTREAQILALEGVGAAQSTLFDILRQGTINRQIQLDNAEKADLKRLQTRFDKGILTEEQLTAGQLKIQRDADRKRAEILTEQAKNDKAAAIIAATIATAVAVTENLGVPPVAALIAILGAAEVALIASQPIPTFHEGKKPELKPGEMYSKILKTESVIPPKQSKEHKGLIDSMIDGNLASYVMKEYQLPFIKQMNKQMPYDDMMFNDMNITKKQGETNKLLTENNRLLKALKPSLHRQFHGWH